MTTRQIAEAVGKSERRVQEWAKKAGAKTASVGQKVAESGHGKSADFDLDETMAIIETGLGRNAAAVWRENAERKNGAGFDAEAMAVLIRETVAAMVPVIVAAVRGVVPEKTIAALPAPEPLTTRDQLRRTVNEYAARSGDHRGAWRELYMQYYYRNHRNIRECAKNRNMDTLDYAENEGIIPDLLALAVTLYGNAA